MSKKPYGVLILHGFPANLECVRPVEPPIKALGLPICMPLLRGLGAESPEALQWVTWHDWLADAETALADLLTESEKAIIIGLSMGGALTLMLAKDYGEKLDSVILVAASVQLLSPLAPGRPFNFMAPLLGMVLKKWDFPPDPSGLFQGSYTWAPMGAVLSVLDLSKSVRTQLSKVKTPSLLIQSRKDDTVAPENMDIIYQGISTSTEQKKIIWFEKTGHDMFRDCERDAVIGVIMNYVTERIGSK
jgi:carboxylesterase